MRTSLNFGWTFAPGRFGAAINAPLKGGTPVSIPHNAVMASVQYTSEDLYQKEFTYQLHFDLRDDSPVKLLRFDGVMLQFDCYLNGVSLGHFVSGYLPVIIDISAFVKPKGNLLTVFVDGREDPTVPPFGKVVDYLTFAGIYREVYVDCLPARYVKDVFVEGNARGEVQVRFEGEGDSNPHYALYDGEQVVIESDQPRFKIKKPRLWSLEDPYLYTLEVRYGSDVRKVRFGFRDATFSPEGFFLNGKKVKIVGLNRHQTYPYFGPAAPKSLQEDDADLLKATGINLVRTSHYPQSEHFLNRCDEIGLLVVDEIPGWQFVGTDEVWRGNCRDFARRMILKERNHPCLVAYGLRIDESADDDELYSSIQAIKQALDPNRASLGVRNFKDSHCLEDVYGYNDFSCDSLDHGCDPSAQIKAGKGKAILITESNGHMYPTKSFDPTGIRVEHALRHAKVLEDVLADDGYCGAITWCAFDYNTHKEFGSDDHICHHGVYDIFRNPKYAAAFFASQGEKPFIEIASLTTPGDFPEALMPKIYAFTNADYVELYRGDKFIGKFFPASKEYPHLAHAPIVIDDVIGATFDEPNIAEKDAKKIVEVFNYIAQNGFKKLKLPHKILFARLAGKYHLSFSDAYAMYAKYIQSWGEGSATFRFDAYKGGSKFASVVRGPSTAFHLKVTPSKETLVHGDTYDAVRVRIEKKDQYGTTMPYASDPIQVETKGPIEVYGPNLFSLYGGASAIYVRSLPVRGPSEGVLRIHYGDEVLETRFLVKPA